MNRVLKWYAYIFSLWSLVFMCLAFYGMFLDGTYYFYEYNQTLVLIELILTLFAIPIILLLLKEAVWDYGI